MGLLVQIFILFLSTTVSGLNSASFSTAPGLLIDATVSNTTPAYSHNFCYNIRYRCASLTDNCIDAFVTMEFPVGIEVASVSSGGNIASSEVTVLSNGNTEVIFHLENPGNPNTLTAGSSGRLVVCLKWNCISAAGSQVPMAGTNFNFVVNPTFFANGSSGQASNLADVLVPTFGDCIVTPPTVTSLVKTQSDFSDVVHPGGVTNWTLRRPAHIGPTTFYDTIPENTHFVDYVGQNFNTIELLIGGTWYDIGIGQINSWVEQNYNNGTLDNLVANGVQTGASAVVLDYSATSLGSYYLDGPTALRITTPAGNNSAANRSLKLHVDPTTAIGSSIQNCMSSSDVSLGRTCDVTNVGDPEPVIMDFRKLFDAGIGEPYPSSFPFSRLPPIDKQAEDVVYRLNYTHSNGNSGSTSAIVISDTLPLGFDFVQGAGGNDWKVFLHAANDINEPFALDTQMDCANPNFIRSVDPVSGRVVLKWVFTNCTFYGRFNANQQLQILFTSRFTAEELIGPTIVNDAEVSLSDNSRIYCDDFGQEVRGNCPDQLITNLPTVAASVTASKFVRGSLDTVYSRYPQFGDTDASGLATYEIYMYNYGFEGLEKLEIVDILPHIGDYSLTTGEARNSEWNTELASPIEIERFTVGGTWVDDAAHISGDVLYAATYNPCYQNSAGQIKVATGLNEPSSKSCSSSDFDALNPDVGARAFALIWEDDVNPIQLGDGIRVRFQVRQLLSDPDPISNEVAWNSFAVTGTQTDGTELFSTEPLKVGVRSIASDLSGIGNLIWNDLNANGRQDIGELGLPDISVSIYESNGDTIFVGGLPLSTQTDANGNYNFLGLLPNTDYIVRLDNDLDFSGGGLLTDRGLSIADSPLATEDTDSDANLGNNNATDPALFPEIVVTSPAPTVVNNDFDFGFYQGANLCGFAWFDADREGDQEAGELGLDSVIVILLDQFDNEVNRDTTDVAGNYNFENVIPGLYSVQVDTNLITGFAYTIPNAVGNDQIDSDVSTQGLISSVLLESGEIVCNMDIGLTTVLPDAAAISGLVWDEISKDGQRISPEENVEDVTIFLLDDLGFVLQSTSTDELGEYTFENIAPGIDYAIQILPPTNVSISSNQNAGGDDTIDSDVDPVSGISHTVNPLPNEEIEHIDAGICLLYSIGNQVWNDVNQNSIFDLNEPVFSGIKVCLLDGLTMTKLDSTFTDVNGRYIFKDLNLGDYIVEVVIPDMQRSTIDLGSTPTPNVIDNDDNGIGVSKSGVVRSGVISIESGGGMPGDANWTELDHDQLINGMLNNSTTAKSYYTVDFGFYVVPIGTFICLPITIIKQ